jgi:hypothetical protein
LTENGRAAGGRVSREWKIPNATTTTKHSRELKKQIEIHAVEVVFLDFKKTTTTPATGI